MFKVIESVLNNKKVYGVVRGNCIVENISYSRKTIEHLIDWLNTKNIKDEDIYAAIDGYFMIQACLKENKK